MPSRSLPQLRRAVAECRICEDALPHEPRPVAAFAKGARVALIGQAPGAAVHRSGVPWDDPSGKTLRGWMGITDERFYDAGNIAILPMGFCFPGHGKSGDLPPRPECAPQWHPAVLEKLDIGLTLLIGQYAQARYLGDKRGRTLTETVKQWRKYGTAVLPLPHPSPRNRPWLAKNPWFEAEILPVLRRRLRRIGAID